jgi:hypothetical protein
MALGLIGLTPGHPPAWDEARDAYDPPAGDLVELRCEWQDPGGSQRVADAFEWLAEAEYARPPLSRPWVFAGSVRLPDGSLAADRSGACIAVVDFSDSVLALSRAHTSRNEDLWVEARTDAIPPQDTAVRLVFRPAPTRQQRVEVDFRGALFVDGRYTSLPDLADLLQLARHLDPPRVQAIDVSNTLASDLRQLERRLADRGVGPPAVRLIRTASGGAD